MLGRRYKNKTRAKCTQFAGNDNSRPSLKPGNGNDLGCYYLSFCGRGSAFLDCTSYQSLLSRINSSNNRVTFCNWIWLKQLKLSACGCTRQVQCSDSGNSAISCLPAAGGCLHGCGATWKEMSTWPRLKRVMPQGIYCPRVHYKVFKTNFGRRIPELSSNAHPTSIAGFLFFPTSPPSSSFNCTTSKFPKDKIKCCMTMHLLWKPRCCHVGGRCGC